MLTLIQKVKAASAYRALIRAQKFTFVGDAFALQAAHAQSRLIFSQLSSPSSITPSTNPPLELLSGTAADEHIQSAFEIASYLRKNVVQGIKNEQGAYRLRFTDETERGDNDTIKRPSDTEAREMRPPRQGTTVTGNEGVKRRRRTVPVVEPESS